MTSARVPLEIRTERLLIRPWGADLAAALEPVLRSNHEYLAPWIPARVATPASVKELEARLAGFRAEFDANREWRYALLSPDAAAVYGDVGLFPRDATRRVPLVDADRVEVGYWLRQDLMGRGLATEATRAALDVAKSLGGMLQVEIRCDARNLPSAAIPQRLGFTLAHVEREPNGTDLQVWVLPLTA